MARMRMHSRGLMLQCVVVCCSVRQCMCFNVLQRVVVLQYVAVSCSVLAVWSTEVQSDDLN